MQIRVTSGSAAAGLGIIGTGLALALPEEKWIGWLVVAAGILVFLFDIRIEHGLPRIGQWSRRLHQWGPWVLIFVAPIIGVLWLFLQPANKKTEGSSIANLAELGWTVKQGPDEILFEIVSRPLPSMKESAAYFRQLSKPFQLRFQSLENLKDLHYLADVVGCTKIEINAGEFTDISELQGFANLTSLTISQVPLNGVAAVDLTPLASLTSLRQLNIGMVRAKNIEALANLKNLKSLNLTQTLISDISPLVGLLLLESLDIRGTRVTDLSPLSKHQKLEELTIGGVQIPGLLDLVSLSNLKRISIIEQSNLDLTSVGALVNLESLWIWGGPSFDASPLRRLTKLRALTITGLGIGAMTPIANSQIIGDLKELRSLTLGQLQIGDLIFSENLQNLNEINLASLPISSIAALAKIMSLKKISLFDIPVIDISPLLTLSNLTEFTVARTPARSDVLSELARRGVKVISR